MGRKGGGGMPLNPPMGEVTTSVLVMMAITVTIVVGAAVWADKLAWRFSRTGYEIGAQKPFRALPAGIVFVLKRELVDWAEGGAYGAKGPDGRIYRVSERTNDSGCSNWTINRAVSKRPKDKRVILTVVGMADDYPPRPS